MASRQRRQIQVQQLQENILIHRSLLHRQAEEFGRNLRSCVDEVQNEAAQCVGSVGHSPADVQKLQKMLRKVDDFTEIISRMNSSLFDVLENTCGEDSGNQQEEEEQEEVPPPAQSRRDSVVSSSSFGSRDNDGEPRPQSQPRSTQATVPQPSPEAPSAPSLPSLPPQPTPSVAGPLTAASSLPPASTSAAVVRQPSQQIPPVFAAAPEQASSALIVQAPTVNVTVDPLFGQQVGSGLVGAMPQSMDAVAGHLSGSASYMPSMDQLSLAAAAARTVTAVPTVPKTSDVYALPHGELGLPLAGSASRREGVLGSKAPPLAQHLPSPIAQPIGLSGSSRAGVPSVPITNEKPLGQDKLRPNMSLQVVVTHVENPWSFYIARCRQMLLKLNKEINDHLWKTWEIVANVGIGSLCLAQFTDEVFYRAQIQHMYSDGNAAVYFVDYGNVFITKLKEMKVLPEHLRELPALAIHCCLSEVVPSSKTGAWTQKAINEFQGLVMGEEMMCRPLPLSRVYPHLPVLVELDQVQSVRGEGSIKRHLIQKQLACSIVNEDLLALLERDKGSRLFGPSPHACQLPVSDSALEGDPQVKPGEACPVASAAFESVPSQSESLLTSAKLQKILRRIPKFAPDFGKRPREKEFETQLSEKVSCSGDVYRSVRVRGEFEGQQSVGAGGDLEAGQSVHSGSDVPGNHREPSAFGGSFSREETAVSDDHAANRDENTGKGDVGTTLSQTFQTLFKSLTGSDELTSFRAMAATLNSPTDFYIHRVCPETGHLLDDTMRKLNERFSNTQRHKLSMRTRKLEARSGVLCCAQFKDELFYRGLVLKTESVEGAAKKVQVFFIDFGDTAWIPRSQVYLLPAEFRDIDPQAIWCSLAYVKPLSAGEGESSEWQWEEKAVQEFRRLLDGDRVFDILAGGQLPSPKGSADAVQTAPLQVIVVDREDDDLCINHDLIVRNFAASYVAPPSAGMTGEEADEDENEELDRSFDSDAMWQDMEADANSLRNTYKVDIEDAGVAVTGVNFQPAS